MIGGSGRRASMLMAGGSVVEDAELPAIFRANMFLLFSLISTPA